MRKHPNPKIKFETVSLDRDKEEMAINRCITTIYFMYDRLTKEKKNEEKSA